MDHFAGMLAHFYRNIQDNHHATKKPLWWVHMLRNLVVTGMKMTEILQNTETVN